MIETKRLKIYPAMQNEMEDFIDTQNNDALRAAYSEMLEGCLKHPNEWEWYAIWMIELKDGTHIGELCFKGLDLNGVVEVGYGISEEHQCQGYATEAIKAVLAWAFQDSKVAGIYIYLHFGDNYAEDPTYNSVPAILYAWSACLAILGSAYKWYNHRTRPSEFMTKHSYGLYVFHYLPLSVSAYFLTKYTSLPPILIYFIVLICGFAVF